MYTAYSGTSAVSVHTATEPWTDATWIYATFPTVMWDTLGGDFERSSWVGYKGAGGGVDFVRNNDQWFGGALATARLVQEWVDGKSANYGVVLVGPEKTSDFTGVNYNTYYGSVGVGETVPKLIVSYTSPTDGFDHSFEDDDGVRNSRSESSSSRNGGKSSATRESIGSDSTYEIVALVMCTCLGILVLVTGFVTNGMR